MFRLMFVLLFVVYCFSQQIATLSDGKKIEVFDNGTWKMQEVIVDSSCQCKSLIDTKDDKVSGDSFEYSNPITIVKDQEDCFQIMLIIGTKASLILSIQIMDATCIDKGSEINILFTDGSRVKLKNEANFSCDSESTVYFGGIFGKNDILHQLKNKKIATMRVWTLDSFVEADFTPQNYNDFHNAINCLMK